MKRSTQRDARRMLNRLRKLNNPTYFGYQISQLETLLGENDHAHDSSKEDQQPTSGKLSKRSGHKPAKRKVKREGISQVFQGKPKAKRVGKRKQS